MMAVAGDGLNLIINWKRPPGRGLIDRGGRRQGGNPPAVAKAPTMDQ